MAVPSYRPGQVADLLDVSVDTVRRWADAGRVKTTRSEGGQRLIDGADLARFLHSHASSHGLTARAQHSARNRFAGIVTNVVKDKVAAQVELQTGTHRMVALLTREAVDELGLAPGVMCVAAVKSTNVTLETVRE